MTLLEDLTTQLNSAKGKVDDLTQKLEGMIELEHGLKRANATLASTAEGIEGLSDAARSAVSALEKATNTLNAASDALIRARSEELINEVFSVRSDVNAIGPRLSQPLDALGHQLKDQATKSRAQVEALTNEVHAVRSDVNAIGPQLSQPLDALGHQLKDQATKSRAQVEALTNEVHAVRSDVDTSSSQLSQRLAELGAQLKDQSARTRFASIGAWLAFLGVLGSTALSAYAVFG